MQLESPPLQTSVQNDITYYHYLSICIYFTSDSVHILDKDEEIIVTLIPKSDYLQITSSTFNTKDSIFLYKGISISNKVIPCFQVGNYIISEDDYHYISEDYDEIVCTNRKEWIFLNNLRIVDNILLTSIHVKDEKTVFRFALPESKYVYVFIDSGKLYNISFQISKSDKIVYNFSAIKDKATLKILESDKQHEQFITYDQFIHVVLICENLASLCKFCINLCTKKLKLDKFIKLALS
jgi:hypothetical protein